MECFNCKETDATEQFYVEDLECPHCDESMQMSFFLCLKCGAVWKMLGDKMLSGVVFDASELAMATGRDVEELFSMFSEDKIFKSDDTKEMDMKEYFSKFVTECVRCNKAAYKIGELSYKCSCCNFEWEVVDFD